MSECLQSNFITDTHYPIFTNFLKNGLLTPEGIALFQEHIHDFYRENKRSFTWREKHDPYYIIVSEIMLQQTQTHRVIDKFEEFITEFPTILALSQAPASAVITRWQGLGYNRRALALHKIAQLVIQQYKGSIPDSPAILVTFPGIGKATAASICAFAFNKPTIFIETNIRTVFIHTFFSHETNIHDDQLLPLVEQTVDKNNPRHWYYALMDYGVALKKEFINPSRKSTHHTRQSRFEGSERQIRGMILRALTHTKTATFQELCTIIEREPDRIFNNLQELITENFITKINTDIFSLTS